VSALDKPESRSQYSAARLRTASQVALGEEGESRSPKCVAPIAAWESMHFESTAAHKIARYVRFDPRWRQGFPHKFPHK